MKAAGVVWRPIWVGVAPVLFLGLAGRSTRLLRSSAAAATAFASLLLFEILVEGSQLLG